MLTRHGRPLADRPIPMRRRRVLVPRAYWLLATRRRGLAPRRLSFARRSFMRLERLNHGLPAPSRSQVGVLGASGLHRLGTGAAAAAPSACRDRAADRRPPGRAGDARRCFRSSRRSSCRRWCRSTASTGQRPALDLAFCALPHATTQKVISRSARARRRSTKVVDLSADFRLADTAAYAQVVRPRASRAGAAARGGLRPGRGLSRRDQAGAAGRQSGLLHDLRPACADAAAARPRRSIPTRS